MSISIGGLASGLDTNSLIDQLLALERIPITNLQFRQVAAVARADVFKDIAGRLSTLKDLAFDLTLDATFDKKSTNVTNPGMISILSTTASVGADNGTYSINVDQLATSHTVASSQQVDSTSALGLSGTFTVNGENVTVGVGDSLTDIRDTINGTANVGVTASIVDNTLRLKSDTSGSANVILFADDLGTDILTTLGILDGADAINNQLVAADDARVYIDGQLVIRSSNTISDAITGVTLKLTAVNTFGVEPAATLTVSQNTNAIIASIQAFVDQYNSVMDFIHTKNTEARVPDAKTATDKLKGVLNNNFLLGSIQSGLRLDVGSTVAGLSSASSSLSFIGISVSTELAEAGIGKLEIDMAVLTDAINGAIDVVTVEDVKALFNSNASTEPFEFTSTGIAGRLHERIESLVGTGGRVDTMESLFRSEEDRLQDSIDRLEMRIETKETQLIRRFTSMEVLMSRMRTQSDWLTMQIANLPKMS